MRMIEPSHESDLRGYIRGLERVAEEAAAEHDDWAAEEGIAADVCSVCAALAKLPNPPRLVELRGDVSDPDAE